MLAAQLWLLPHTRTDQLTSNVICITFGQPLIQSELLTHAAESFPKFKENIHAIGLEDDGLPSILEKLDHLTFSKEVCRMCLLYCTCLANTSSVVRAQRARAPPLSSH